MSNNQENAEQEPQPGLTDLERPDEAVELTDEQAGDVVGGRMKISGPSDPMESEAQAGSESVM